MKPVKRKYNKKPNLEMELLIETKQLHERTRKTQEEIPNEPVDDDKDWTPSSYGIELSGHISNDARRILEEWMFNHRYYCYPTKIEKLQLSLTTNLSVQRVSNWFVNSRRRLLPKMIENDGKKVDDYIITRKRQSRLKTADIKPKLEVMDKGSVDLSPDNKYEYEYTLNGNLILKNNYDIQGQASTDDSTPTQMLQMENTNATEECTNIPDNNLEEKNDETDERRAALGIPKQAVTGILVDKITNMKCFYVLVQPFN